MNYEEFKSFFTNIDCFFKCIYGDIEKEQHIEIQQIDKTQNTEIEQNTEKQQKIEITYQVEIEPYIENEIDENNHIFTVKKNNQTYQVIGRESIKI